MAVPVQRPGRVQSFDRAYQVASPGSTVVVTCPGSSCSYPDQTIASSSAKPLKYRCRWGAAFQDGTVAQDLSGCIHFQPDQGKTVTVSNVSINAPYVYLDGFTLAGARGNDGEVIVQNQPAGGPCLVPNSYTDIIVRNVNAYNFFIKGTAYLSFVDDVFDGQYALSNTVTQCGQSPQPYDTNHVLFDGVTVKNVYWDAAGEHVEGIHWWDGDQVLITNSRFLNDAQFDINFDGDRGNLTHITVQNTIFDDTCSHQNFAGGCQRQQRPARPVDEQPRHPLPNRAQRVRLQLVPARRLASFASAGNISDIRVYGSVMEGPKTSTPATPSPRSESASTTTSSTQTRSPQPPAEPPTQPPTTPPTSTPTPPTTTIRSSAGRARSPSCRSTCPGRSRTSTASRVRTASEPTRAPPSGIQRGSSLGALHRPYPNRGTRKGCPGFYGQAPYSNGGHGRAETARATRFPAPSRIALGDCSIEARCRSRDDEPVLHHASEASASRSVSATRVLGPDVGRMSKRLESRLRRRARVRQSDWRPHADRDLESSSMVKSTYASEPANLDAAGREPAELSDVSSTASRTGSVQDGSARRRGSRSADASGRRRAGVLVFQAPLRETCRRRSECSRHWRAARLRVPYRFLGHRRALHLHDRIVARRLRVSPTRSTSCTPGRAGPSRP